MPNNELLNFFCMIDENQILRVNLDRSAQRTMTNIFLENQSGLIDSQLNLVPFSITYKLDRDEVFIIDEFNFPGEILTAINEPTGFEILDLRQDNTPDIKTIFTGYMEQENRVLFQYFDNRQVLFDNNKNIFSLGDNRLFRELREPSINIKPEVTAAIIDNRLLFNSYYKVRRFLNLEDYYRLATDQEISQFSELDQIHINNMDNFYEMADDWVRKKIAIIMDREILNDAQTQNIQRNANAYNIEIQLVNGSILMPNEKANLKDTLRFLDEDYYSGVISDRHYLTNSKRTVNED